MILGRFESFSKRPVVDCYVYINALNVEGVVPFLIDTGADCSLLMPADAQRLKIDCTKIYHTRKCTGVGGDTIERIVPASIFVSSETIAYGYRIALGIAEPNEQLEECPSLLGMDILRHWKLVCDHTNDLLQIEIQMSDDERPL